MGANILRPRGQGEERQEKSQRTAPPIGEPRAAGHARWNAGTASHKMHSLKKICPRQLRLAALRRLIYGPTGARQGPDYGLPRFKATNGGWRPRGGSTSDGWHGLQI